MPFVVLHHPRWLRQTWDINSLLFFVVEDLLIILTWLLAPFICFLCYSRHESSTYVVVHKMEIRTQRIAYKNSERIRCSDLHLFYHRVMCVLSIIFQSVQPRNRRTGKLYFIWISIENCLENFNMKAWNNILFWFFPLHSRVLSAAVFVSQFSVFHIEFERHDDWD